MRVDEFEEAVWKTDRILIRIRAPEDTQVEEYDYSNEADQGLSVARWLRIRITGKLKSHKVSVICGDYTEAHRGRRLRTLRDTY